MIWRFRAISVRRIPSCWKLRPPGVVVELYVDLQSCAVVAFCFLDASLLLGDHAELVVAAGRAIRIVEPKLDLKGLQIFA